MENRFLPTSSLPQEIRELLSKHIKSVGQLEALFTFCDFPERNWTAEQLGQELRSNTTSAAKQILHLSQQGFIKQTDDRKNFIFGPQNPGLGKDVEKLRTYYKEMPVAVIAYIYQQPQDKLKSFADAFKLRKD
jgi:DNA-binding IclR family transcriptional regulator